MKQWENTLLRFLGWKMKIKIEDGSGEHHSPARFYTLASIQKSPDGELKLYFNELQFIAFPLFDSEDTRLEMTPIGGRFISHDRGNELIYSAEFYL